MSVWNSIVNGVGDLGRAQTQMQADVLTGAHKMASKAIDKSTGHVASEMRDVGDKAKQGDLVGAAIELHELLGPGTHVAGSLAALGLIPDDPVTINLVSGIANAAYLNPVGVAKDMHDLGDALKKQNAKPGKAAPRHHVHRPASEAARKAKARAKAKAKSEAKGEAIDRSQANARERILVARRDSCGGGYAGAMPGGSLTEQIAALQKTIQDLIAQLQKDPSQLDNRLRSPSPDIVDQIKEKPDSFVSKLPPNATFEDLVAAFMMDQVMAQQQDIKKLMEELDTQKEIENTAHTVNSTVGTLMSLSSVAGPMMDVANAPTKMAFDGTSGKAEKDAQDSRQILFEQLKDAMQKLQQMFQSLSNILNSMHEGAMSSIRNIK